MALSTPWQPCWAWALRDGRLGNNSSRSHQGLSRAARLTRRASQHSNSLSRLHTAPQDSSLVSQPRETTAWPVQHRVQQQQSPSRGLRDAHQLPDPVLQQQIKACDSWAGCVQLLQTQGARLDAMLTSTLCTHTVHLFEVQQYKAAAAVDSAAAAAAAPQHSLAAGSVGEDPTRSKTRGRSRSSASASPPDSTAFGRYMLLLAAHVLQLAGAGTFRPQQYSNVLWCFARCGYRPPQSWVHAYLSQAQQQLPSFPPRNLSQLIWATAALQVSPPSSFIPAFLAASGAQLQHFKAINLANTLWGLATLGVQPLAPWLAAALAASAGCWSGFRPFEFSISAWAFAKLGVCFRRQGLLPAQQQQQQQSSSGKAAGAAGAAAAGAEGGATLQESGFGWLLGSIALLSPAMGLQEIANLMWGLAVGKAVLTPQQLQALGNQVCIILAQSAPTSLASASSRSSTSSIQQQQHPSQQQHPFTASLTVCLRALAALNWVPSLPQAQMLVRLLSQALATGGLDMRHASLLLHSLGRLQLRPPLGVMSLLMDGLARGLEGAQPADVLQVLTGCRCLGWRVSKAWWGVFYRDSLGALQQGNAAELSWLLATVATFRPVTPTPQWWEVYWDSMGVELEAAVEARGLGHLARSRKLPRGCVSPAAGLLKQLKRERQQGRQQQQQHRQHALQELRRDQGRLGLQEQQDACASSGSSSGGCGERRWHPHPLAWVAMVDALQVVASLQGPSQQQQQHGEVRTAVDMSGPRAVNVLWACARLKKVPPVALLWQLVLLVLADAHSLSPGQLAAVLWSLGHLLHRFGRGRVVCGRLVRPLALVVQWRLMAGLAGRGAERARVVQALRYVASEDGRLMSLLLLPALGGKRLEASGEVEGCCLD